MLAVGRYESTSYVLKHTITTTPDALERLYHGDAVSFALYVRIGPQSFVLEKVNGAIGIVLFKPYNSKFVPVCKLPLLDYWYNLVYSESKKAGNYAEFGNWRVRDHYVEHMGHRVAECQYLNQLNSDICPLIALYMTEDESQIW